MSIERINFIERKAFVFTYGILMAGLGGIALLCLLFLGLLTLRTSLAGKKVVRLTAEIETLKSRQQKLLMSDRPADDGTGSELEKVFSSAPRYSEMIADIAGRLPGSVWLNGFKGSATATAARATEKEKKEERKKAAAEGRPSKAVVIKGMARSPNDLALFLAQLNASPILSNVVLTSSKADSGNFVFSIESDVRK